MSDTLYEIEKLEEPILRDALEFKYRIKRNYKVTYNHPVEKLDDGTYRTEEITLEPGSTVMLFENLEAAETSLGILSEF
jgi:predicted component of type VI protein secretion system